MASLPPRPPGTTAEELTVHFHIGFLEWVVFLMYYLITKAIFCLINLETRRNNLHVPAAVSGLFS
jgi:hypothetical protein